MMEKALNPSNYYYNPWAAPVLIVAFLSFAMTLFVWSKNKRSLVNLFFCLASFCVAVWLFATVGMFSSKEVGLGLFWNRLIWMAVPFISISVYSYSVMWLELKRQKKFILAGYAVALAFAVPAVFSPLFIAGGRMHFWGVYPEYGILSYPFLLLHFGLMVASFMNFVRAYRSTALLVRKRQIRYIFLAYLMAYVASVDYLPGLNLEVYPFGYIFVFLWLGIMAFTIIRYKVMEIETVIHRTLLWILSSAAVFLPIFILIYLIRDSVRDFDRLGLSVLFTVMFFGIVLYYRWLQPRIDHAFRRRKYDYYRVLDEIGQKTGSELNIKKISDRLFKELKEVLYIKNGMLLAVSQDGSRFEETGMTGYGHIPGPDKNSSTALPSGCFLIQWLAKTGKAMEKEQIMINPDYRRIREESLAWFDRFSVEVLIPVIMEQKLTGLVALGKKENLQAYTIRDVELLEKMGRQIAVTLDNALHHQDIVEKERIAEELRLGRQIQSGLLPGAMPEIPRLAAIGMMQPAKEIGRDYFDFITLSDKKQMGIVIGGVAEKGVAAGLLMAMVKTAIHIFSQKENSPGRILHLTREALRRHMSAEQFMTLLYLIWNSPDYSVTYSSSGQGHILILKNRSREIEDILPADLSSGAREATGEGSFRLEVRDRILLFTDGVTGARNPSGEEFGLVRLKEAFLRHGAGPARDLIRLLRDEVGAFTGKAGPSEDITLVVLEAVQ